MMVKQKSDKQHTPTQVSSANGAPSSAPDNRFIYYYFSLLLELSHQRERESLSLPLWLTILSEFLSEFSHTRSLFLFLTAPWVTIDHWIRTTNRARELRRSNCFLASDRQLILVWSVLAYSHSSTLTVICNWLLLLLLFVDVNSSSVHSIAEPQQPANLLLAPICSSQ